MMRMKEMPHTAFGKLKTASAYGRGFSSENGSVTYTVKYNRLS